SIGEPGTQLTMRTFHIGGVARRAVEEDKVLAKKAGIVKFERINAVVNAENNRVALTRNGEILIHDAKGRELDKYPIFNGSVLRVEEGQHIAVGTLLAQWDPHNTPILSEVGGRVRFEDIKLGETLREETDPGGSKRLIIMEHKGDLHPSI